MEPLRKGLSGDLQRFVGNCAGTGLRLRTALDDIDQVTQMSFNVRRGDVTRFECGGGSLISLAPVGPSWVGAVTQRRVTVRPTQLLALAFETRDDRARASGCCAARRARAPDNGNTGRIGGCSDIFCNSGGFHWSTLCCCRARIICRSSGVHSDRAGEQSSRRYAHYYQVCDLETERSGSV